MGDKYILLLILIMVPILLIMVPIIYASPLGACTIDGVCVQQSEIGCMNSSFTEGCMTIGFFEKVCFPVVKPHTWEEGKDCPPVPIPPPVNNTLGACMTDTGECIDTGMYGQNVTETLCNLLPNTTFLIGGNCSGYVGACFLDIPDAPPTFGDPVPAEQICTQTGGDMIEERCCMDGMLSGGLYMNELLCTVNALGGEWMGLGTKCTDDFSDGDDNNNPAVPEFGFLGGLVIISLVGLFVWRKR